MKKIIAVAILSAALLLTTGSAFAADDTVQSGIMTYEQNNNEEETTPAGEGKDIREVTEDIIELIRADETDKAKEMYADTVKETKEGEMSFSIEDYARISDALMDNEATDAGFYVLKEGNMPDHKLKTGDLIDGNTGFCYMDENGKKPSFWASCDGSGTRVGEDNWYKPLDEYTVDEISTYDGIPAIYLSKKVYFIDSDGNALTEGSTITYAHIYNTDKFGKKLNFHVSIDGSGTYCDADTGFKTEGTYRVKETRFLTGAMVNEICLEKMPAAVQFYSNARNLSYQNIIYPGTTIYCVEDVSNRKTDFELVVNNDGVVGNYTAEQGFQPERPYSYGGKGYNTDTGRQVLYLNTYGSNDFYIRDNYGYVDFHNKLDLKHYNSKYSNEIKIKPGNVLFRLSDDKLKPKNGGEFDVIIQDKDGNKIKQVIINYGQAFFAEEKEYKIDRTSYLSAGDDYMIYLNEVENEASYEKVVGFNGEGFYKVDTDHFRKGVTYILTGPLKVGDIISRFTGVGYFGSNGHPDIYRYITPEHQQEQMGLLPNEYLVRQHEKYWIKAITTKYGDPLIILGEE